MTNNSNINSLGISHPQIPRTDFLNLTNLYGLDLSNLGWGNVDLSIYPNLARVGVRGNNLTVLDVSKKLG